MSYRAEIRTDPGGVWNEYEQGAMYDYAIDLYGTVEQNEDFFLGNQWRGVNAPDLQKPVLNILKRCVTFYIATIISDDIGTELIPFRETEGEKDLMRLWQNDIERIFEQDRTKAKMRQVIRNAAVDGDGILYWYWDDRVKTGTQLIGDIRSELVSGINVLFGNPYETDPQKQPYIIVAMRKPVEEVRAAAECAPELIVPDGDTKQNEQGGDNDLVTVLVKLWRDAETDTVWCVKTVPNATVREKWDTGCERYPIAWMRWDTIRNNYHGQAAVTGLIPNQITINKLFAMYIRSVELNAFPKIVYDKTKFVNGWSNRVGEAIGVYGDVGQTAVNVLRGGDVSSQVMEVIQTCISLTKECMGANDSALGSVNAERAAASAIIATQNASQAPLEIQRQEFFDFVEQCVNIVLDMMGTYYGTRDVRITGVEDEERTERVDYELIKKIIRQLNVSVGSSAYWSELAQMQTMDNLLQSGIIQDTVLYLESVPDKWLPNKQKLIDAAKKMQEQQAAGGQPGEQGAEPGYGGDPAAATMALDNMMAAKPAAPGGIPTAGERM